MSKRKFTPGPWNLSIVSGVCIGVQTEGTVAEVICNSILPDSDEEYEKEKDGIIADMTLISAAPEMFAALKIVQSYINGHSDGHFMASEDCRTVNDAVRKATS